MTYSVAKRKFDVVIVGAGGSGMRASLQLARAGLNVAVLTKVFPTRSHTVAAQGGIGASLGNMNEDNWHYHFYDTVKGSDWLGDQDAIEFMCREAPKAVYDLEHMGMPFDRNPDGTIYQRPFGGHTANYGEKAVERACAAADRTGHAMLHTLYQQNVKEKTSFFVEWLAMDLIRNADGDVVGVTALEMETGDVHIFEAKTTLLATGGAGRIFAASTNAFINTGDGLGMAARAGIPLEDMEFWQFHPTGVAGAGVLLTEGCRGEGAILRNSNGERFMERYAPAYKDLAPRDYVSRCMDQEIKEGRGCGPNKDYINLDMTHLGADTIMKRLPSVFEIGHNFANVDITKEPIPVVPTIHYQMGGIPTNIHGQVVTQNAENKSVVVNGLYAVGECSCVSVHGANRLGTNSLLDLLVFGRAAGNHIVEFNKTTTYKGLPAGAADATIARIERLDNATSGEYAQDVANDIRATMQLHAGVFRTQASMDEGVAKIAALRTRVNNINLKDKSRIFNTARIEALEVENLIESAEATMVSAAARHESRGAHSVNDYGDTPAHPNGRNDTDWHKHTLWHSQGSKLTYKPVQMTPLSVESIHLKCAASKRPLHLRPATDPHQSPSQACPHPPDHTMALRTFKIYRYDPDTDAKPYMQTIEVELDGSERMLLDALMKLKAMDPAISFRRSCREGVCGSDAMNINGKNGLACLTNMRTLTGTITLKPLPGLPVIRDLIVDMTQFFKQYNSIKPYLINDNVPPEKERLQSPEERDELNGLYECILCASCSTACPSFWWNPDKFVGPAGLLQAYRFIADSRDEGAAERLDNLEDPYRLFRCHSIMNCVDVCPKGLNPTKAIGKIKEMMVLRTV